MSDAFFQLKVEADAHVVEFSLPPELDPLEFDRLNVAMLALLDGRSSNRWVMDLTNVDYMGSAMLGLMVNVRQHIKNAGGKLALCGLSPPLLGIFKNCCLERLFVITKTREDALARV